MTRATIGGVAFVVALVVLLALVVRNPGLEQDVEPGAASPAATTPAGPAAPPASRLHSGFLYGRIIDVDGVTHEGRLRWGRNQEAFWSDFFNGTKAENPWTAHAALARRPEDRAPLEIFGWEIGGRPLNLRRPFMARFGDLARIEAHIGRVQVTLKNGTRGELDRFAAGDIDDGVRVWDDRRAVADIDARRIRTIEFLPTAALLDAPERLHGTVRTRQGHFSGFILWDQQECVGADELDGRTADGEVSLRFDTIRSIARRSRDSAQVSRRDGGELVLSQTREVGHGNRGILVDDPRYGRVRISWGAFERVDFSPGGSGPAYGDFPPGRALKGSVTTRDGRRLDGRLVYDFDESETTETLDASLEGVDYIIPFGLVTSIVLHGRDGRSAQRGTVVLHHGEELQLERTGDLGEGHAGMLIFAAGRERPDYVPWADVERIDFDRATPVSPPPSRR
jgi:hypothetical protein